VREFDNIERVGRSSKTTLTDGAAMFDESTDDSPVELDGLGGNAGISTPYLPFGGNPPQQYPEHQQMNDESVMRINGQEVRATLDGVGIPFALLLHLLQNGAVATEYTLHIKGRGFHTIQVPIDSYGVGLFGHETPPTWIRPNGDGGYTGNGGYNFFSFGDNRGGQIIEHPTRLLQIPKLPERDLTSAEIDALRKDLNALLTDKCKNFLTELAKTINNSQTPYNSDPNVNTATNTYSDIINLFDEVRLQTAKNNGFRLTNGRDMMSTTRSGANREKIVVNVERGSNRDFSKVDLARAQTLIHEFIHIYSRESTTHFQMSNYAYAAAKKFDKDFKFILREKGDNIMKLNPTTTFDDFRSADFGTILRKYCDGK
jgi:hypothetical protein